MSDTTAPNYQSLLAKAFELKPSDGALSALMLSEFSNAPSALPPEKGFPFGGLLAALCAKAMRQGLDIKAPLRSLTVQYLSAARYDETVQFQPRMLRNGRQITYASLEASQGDRLTLNAIGTFGHDDPEASTLLDRQIVPPAVDSLPAADDMRGPTAPRFADMVEYRFNGGPNIMGGNIDRPRTERCWMRMRDGKPLDEMGLCYLLDAMYPPSFTGFKRPPLMTSVDLRYDFITAPNEANAPDGWAYFEYTLIEHSGGWAVDDAIVWGADGSVLATARQRRKVLSRI